MQERAKATKSKILKTAIRIFSENGFYGTRIDGIAAAAGVNKQRIYAYYNNKEGLFEAALAYVFEEVSLFSEKTLEQAVREPENLTSLLLTDFMNLHDRYPYFWRMLAWANLNKDVRADSILDIRAGQDRMIEKAFARAREKGCVKDISLTAYIFGLMAVSFFYHANRKTLSMTFSSGIYTPAGREQLMEQLISLFQVSSR
ncbi:MAG: TetR/AcrR family transcriptional regulator [Victivallaceae bacterium]|nr:TetR/AcrR family transcriptional regulator [Victivallaceae bacterium]